MDLGRAFGYPMQDKNWIVKILIGTVVTIIPFVNFIGIGYQLRVMRDIMSGKEDAMPEWDNWGDDFIKGLIVIGGAVLYFLPMILLSFCTNIISAVLDDETISTLISCCMALPSLVYYVVVGLMLVGAVTRYAVTGDFSDAFLNFGGRFAELRGNIGNAAMLLLFSFIVGIVVGIGFLLTFWICGLGFLFIWFSNMVNAHLAAQYGTLIGANNASVTTL